MDKNTIVGFVLIALVLLVSHGGNNHQLKNWKNNA